jgi:hypothetical protein
MKVDWDKQTMTTWTSEKEKPTVSDCSHLSKLAFLFKTAQAAKTAKQYKEAA